MDQAKRKAISELARKLLAERHVAVSNVVLFGSSVFGQEREGGDVDIIIVSPAFEGRDIFQRVSIVKGLHRALVEVLQCPMDLLFYSDSEWAKGEGIILSQVKRDLAAAS